METSSNQNQNNHRSSWADVTMAGLFLFFLGYLCAYHYNIKHTESITYDTVSVFDTIPTPVPIDSAVISYKTIKVPISIKDTINDTISWIDTVNVDIPITKKVYEDSTYKAVVSGYSPSLDSIIVKNKYITKTITTTAYKNHHWGLGATAGYDPINRKFGIMIGVNYNILQFK